MSFRCLLISEGSASPACPSFPRARASSTEAPVRPSLISEPGFGTHLNSVHACCCRCRRDGAQQRRGVQRDGGRFGQDAAPGTALGRRQTAPRGRGRRRVSDIALFCPCSDRLTSPVDGVCCRCRHRGRDGRCYLCAPRCLLAGVLIADLADPQLLCCRLDLARAFPPESSMDCPHLPHSEREGSPIFYRMLRPELLLLRKHQVLSGTLPLFRH